MRAIHQRFVDEYVRCGIASAAYQRAGYRARGHAAEANASRLRRRPDVAAAVQAALERATTERQAARVTAGGASGGFDLTDEDRAFLGIYVRAGYRLRPWAQRRRAPVWALRNGGLQMECELLVDTDGVDVVLSRRDCQWSAGQRFDEWAQAFTHANLTRGDFERHGWRET